MYARACVCVCVYVCRKRLRNTTSYRRRNDISTCTAILSIHAQNNNTTGARYPIDYVMKSDNNTIDHYGTCLLRGVRL